MHSSSTTRRTQFSSRRRFDMQILPGMSRGVSALALTFMMAWPLGCEQDPDNGAVTEISSALVRPDSCEDVAAILKAKLIRAMEARLQANLERAVYAATYSCDDWGEEEEEEEEEQEEEEEEEEEEASEYSGTNVQVADVDEA